MQKLAISSFCFALFVVASAAAEIPVAFLPKAPTIDGVLDDNLSSLPVQQFAAVEAGAPRKLAENRPTYRIAYGTGFLYLYIEVPDEKILTRDRAYQNGDGFQVVIARPMEDDAPTREFYVLGFTTAPQAAAPWQKQFVWYRNVDISFKALKSAQIATSTRNGRTGIELLLPWGEVYPYHPWLSPAIGFNLSYVKAYGEKESVAYFVVDDGHIQQEQSPRCYTRLRFAPATIAEGAQAYAVLNQNHVEAGQAVTGRVAIASAGAAPLQVTARVMSGEGAQLAQTRETFSTGAGVSVEEISLPVAGLPAGGYTIAWDAPVQTAVPMGLSIVPPFDAEQLRARLERVSDRISAGTLATLQFQLESLEDSRRSLKSYDVAPDLRLGTARFLDDLQAAEQGRIATRTGIERRAYRSKIDGTLQPYSILVPALEPGRRYGLLVFLHGSGEDDRAGLREDLLADGFIELAPNGRGTSNAYTADHAQDDIREAIADVMTNYPIDPNRIVLAGFSMGGYGVYRTFYEDPSRYRALAVFSGHPTLGREMVGDDQPSFLEDKYLEKFRGMRIFVFHGGKDRNAPIELTQELVGKLKALGADVEFHYVPDKGHEAPPPEVKAAFRQWLLRVTAGSN